MNGGGRERKRPPGSYVKPGPPTEPEFIKLNPRAALHPEIRERKRISEQDKVTSGYVTIV
jgi:hypothetical protein